MYVGDEDLGIKELLFILFYFFLKKTIKLNLCKITCVNLYRRCHIDGYGGNGLITTCDNGVTLHPRCVWGSGGGRREPRTV